MKKDNTYLQRILDRLDADEMESAESTLQELRASDPPRFAEGFASRVIDHLEAATGAQNLDQILPRMFRWVAIGGIAATIVMLVLTYYQQDSISIDAMAGIADMSLADDFDF